MIFQDESGDTGTEPSYLCDAELDDGTIGKALSSHQVQEDLLQNGVKKPRNVPSSIATLLVKRNMNNATDPMSAERPIGGHESTERCVLTP